MDENKTAGFEQKKQKRKITLRTGIVIAVVVAMMVVILNVVLSTKLLPTRL